MILAFAGFIIVGVLDWNSLNWPVAIRWPFGGVLLLLGNSLAWAGVAQLSFGTTFGADGELVTDGLYRYTRNPQHLGNIAILFGWMVQSASTYAIPGNLGGVLAFVLTPFAEEPWLGELYGDAYRAYQAKAPRFL